MIVEQLKAAGPAPPRAGRRARASSRSRSAPTCSSARELQQVVSSVFRERQVFRIDHYLGKETVQNVMAFRFANMMFEPIWNRNYIDHIQITGAEDLGIGTRAGYYDHAGALRDLVQNHMLQLVALTCMEPPASFEAEQGARREGQGAHGDHAARPGRHGARAVHARARRAARTSPATSRRRACRTTRTPRPTRRSSSRCTTGAGRACRSSCAPASGSRAR